MQKYHPHSGDPKFPIWLLGDSIPPRWQSYLVCPFDSRHPVIHNIWTSIIDVIQDKVYGSKNRLRVDTNKIFISNAITDINNNASKPKMGHVKWKPEIDNEIEIYRNRVNYNNNTIKLLLCFGSFAFEFDRRVIDNPDDKFTYGHWGAKNLGKEFRNRLDSFDIKKINIIPLLHRSISGGKFDNYHDWFCNPDNSITFYKEGEPNYFNYVGGAIAEKLLRHQDNLEIWIK